MKTTFLGFGSRFVIGGLFTWAGVWKLLSPRSFAAEAAWIHSIISHPEALRYLLPRFELAIGACILAGLFLRPALICAGISIVAFTLGVLAAAWMGDPVNSCGCFGHWVMDSGGPVVLVPRNLILILLIWVAWKHGGSTLSADAGLKPVSRGSSKPLT